MKYFRHGDKVKCFFGQTHDRLQGEYTWDTEEPKEIEIRITKDYANPGELVIGLDDFNINYPGDVHGENEESVVFQLFNYAFCIMKEGKEFEVRPKGTQEKRKEWMVDLNNIIGKQLTVKFAEWSDDNIPLQPVGMAIRDYE